MSEHKHVRVEADGKVLAEAIIQPPDDAGEARAQVSVTPGHLPVGTRQQMADAVHESVVDDHADRLTAAVPRGDAELVDGIRRHLDEPDLRAAGASSIIRGQVKPD